MFVVAPPPHPRQRLPSLDSGKESKQTFTKFLPLFLQKESGFQGSALVEKVFSVAFVQKGNKKGFNDQWNT